MNLFDFANPIAHAADPESSHAAAALMDATGARGRHAERVLAIVRRLPDRTAAELWDEATDDERDELGELQEVRRRCTDLYHAGRIIRGPARACRVRGSTMVTWRVV